MSFKNKQSLSFTTPATAAGGEDTSDSTGRLVSSSYQRAQNPNNFGEVYRIYSRHPRSKQMIAWYKSFNIGTATFNSSTDTWTATDHYLEDSDRVVLSTTGTLPSGYSAGTTNDYQGTVTTGQIYYVVNATSTTFQLALTKGGAAVNGTTAGTGTHTFTIVAKLMAWCGWHYLPNDVYDAVSPHNHWSIETNDSNGLLRTRLEVIADHLDMTQVNTTNAHFTVLKGILGVANVDGQTKGLTIYTAGTGRDKTARWNIVGSADSETGSSAGTNLTISRFNDSGAFVERVVHIDRSNGNIGFGVNTPTAKLHLKAGTATAGSAPLKFSSGTNLTTPENGAFEFDGTNLYFTVGGVRKTVTLL